METRHESPVIRALAQRLRVLLNDCRDAGVQLDWLPGECRLVDKDGEALPELVCWDEDEERWE